MRIRLGQLKQIIREEAAHISEAGSSTGDEAVLEMLTNAFTATVNPEDVQYIRYKVRPNSVLLQDDQGMLGHMHTSANQRSLASVGMSSKQLGDWLATNGARPMKPTRRKPSPMRGPMGPMGGYD